MPTKPTRKKRTARGPTTTPTSASVEAFLATLAPEVRADCEHLVKWMSTATSSEGLMYGRAIVGFGSATITYADGREAPWLKMGFSPRTRALTLYGVVGASTPKQLAALGRHETGKGCLYVRTLSDIDQRALQAIIKRAAK